MVRTLRTLRANEIEVRPAHKVGDKIAHLLYIDSRATTKYLDEWVGWNNWQTEFYSVGNQIVGRLGIWDSEKQMWIWKSDVGSESNIEKEKGLISDTYKRLLVRFGVNELYSAPDILIPDDGYGNKGYKVSEIEYNEHREICHLVIVNRFGKEVYRMTSDNNVIQANDPTTKNVQPCDNRGAIIQSIRDAANKEHCKGIVNEGELRKFVNFYVKKIEKDGWKGDFHFDSLLANWMSRVRI